MTKDFIEIEKREEWIREQNALREHGIHPDQKKTEHRDAVIFKRGESEIVVWEFPKLHTTTEA